MSAASKVSPVTVEQYEQFEGYPGLKDELIYGEIVMSPQPKPLGQQLAENLQRLLFNIVEQYGYVAKQNSNIRFALAHSMPAPDVFVLPATVWRDACHFDRYVSTAPVVVAEVLSPSNRRKPLTDKIRLYLENGVALVIEVHPKRRLVKCYSGTSEPVVACEDEKIGLPDAIAGMINVSDIFVL